MKNPILLLALISILWTCNQQKYSGPSVDELYKLAQEDLARFAAAIAGSSTSDFERSQNIVKWLAENFDWKSTDYQKRTAQQIIERKGGNCNELAIVSKACMDQLDIQYRTVREINLHVNTPRRQVTAEEKIAAAGNRMSVFGQRHNDHVWIEIYDPKTNRWFPADPSMGAVGEEEWLAARYGFGDRYTLNPISEDMVAPFAVLILDKDRNLIDNRTAHYAIDGFNDLYGGKLEKLPSWEKWTSGIHFLSEKAAGAFQGAVNLHEYTEEIKALWETYFKLKKEYEQRVNG